MEQSPRTALMQTLDELAGKRVIYISAPAGHGKTVSAELWTRHRERVFNTKSFWINLDEYDNKVAEFCHRLVFALTYSKPENTVLRELALHPSFNTAPVEFTLRAIDIYIETREPHILVFDDLHVLKNEEILSLIPVFIKRLYNTILLLSREAPPLVFSELVAKGELSLLNAEYLLFTADEIKVFFGKNGRFITARQANEIFMSTGGWAFALRALLLSEEKRTNFTLTEGYLETFFKNNVWDNWDDTLKRFLLLVSVVSELTPKIAEHLIKGDKLTACLSCDKTLRDLAKDNIFIRVSAGVYYFNDLFRDFLLKILGEEQLENEQLRKAGEWFYMQRNHYKAVGYFLKCGYISGVAKGLKLMYDNTSKHPIIEDSMSLIHNSLNNTVLDKYPFLLELEIWLSFIEGRADDFERHINDYFKKLPKIIAKNPSSIQISVMVRCLDYRNSLVEITKKLSRLPLILFAQENTPPITQSLPLFHRSARDFSEYVFDTEKNVKMLVKTLGASAGGAAAMIKNTFLGGLAYERGELSKAHELALEALVDMREDFASEFKFSAFMLLAVVEAALNQQAELERTCDRISEMINADSAYFLIDNFRSFQCRLRLYQGDREETKNWLLRNDISPHEPILFYKIYQYFTTARAYIKHKDYNLGLIFLKKLLKLSERYKRPLDIIEAEILISIIYWKKGGSSAQEALSVLEDAVCRAESYGFIQVFANEGADIAAMLHRMQKRIVQKDYAGTVKSSFVKTLYIAAVAGRKNKQSLTGSTSKDLSFTEKQMTVMRLMCDGYSRNEIAVEMGLKPNGVKSHIELIYRKLDVSTSVEAIMKIKEMEIL